MIAPFFDSPDTADAIVGIFTAIPPFALLRGLMTFRNGVEFGGEGIGWAEVSDPDSEFGMPSVYVTSSSHLPSLVHAFVN